MYYLMSLPSLIYPVGNIMQTTTILVIVYLLASTQSYKILVYSPTLSFSHVDFLGRIADVLIDAGHNIVNRSIVISQLNIHVDHIAATDRLSSAIEWYHTSDKDYPISHIARIKCAR
jgi:hypothetical protein